MSLNPNAGNDTVWLQNMKTTIERGRREVMQAEANLKALKEQETKLHVDARILNVEADDEHLPEALDKTIAELDTQNIKDKSEAERLLNPATGYIPAAAPVQG